VGVVEVVRRVARRDERPIRLQGLRARSLRTDIDPDDKRAGVAQGCTSVAAAGP
jgi:hypothetical protein